MAGQLAGIVAVLLFLLIVRVMPRSPGPILFLPCFGWGDSPWWACLIAVLRTCGVCFSRLWPCLHSCSGP